MSMKRTPLPGVGVQYDVTTRSGRHLSVVVHQDGRRFLGFYAADDPDTCQASFRLDADEAASLAALIAPDPETPDLAMGELDLATERIPVTAKSPYRGRPLGDTRARTRTGASIVAVLRRTAPHPAPGPDFRLEAGDILVVVGTREGVEELAQIIAGG
ncbi:TrkA C-terminal domain-containing protein [Streptomyces sp. TRM 70361]|uniref:cation:proton antiporter regulatory subunit n=1 Tax=Streptomyces sp. TRM 70361 TaxID=3116553 RepID=UPI002E7C1197|nr:TrkA C-terminal domain-containing protein [Streptomyces sp. TRM 70361]MEE1938250.1 TrkA C-terminal domain-containing protein [Streptomyces sp. TRM 70361]